MSLPDLLQTIDALKAEIDALRPLPMETEQRILQKFRLDWNYHSNAMEGNSLTQGETETFLLEGLTAKGKPLKDHLDIKGHNTAINFLLEFIRQPDAYLTEADLRELHRILLVEPYRAPAETSEGLPTTKLIVIGEYKTGPNNVRTPTGEIHFYATPEETPAKMGDLMRWYREESQKNELHPVIIAAIFHHRFTAIHPFDDGNGRMSRLLMNLILMQRGYPPVVLQTQHRSEYLFALRLADQGKIGDFTLLIANNLIRSLELYLKGARNGELDEPDDIDKQVALLKQELRHIEAPVRLTPEIQKSLFHSFIDVLVPNLIKRLSDFDELFSGNSVLLTAMYFEDADRKSGLNERMPKEELLLRLNNYNYSPNIERFESIAMQFHWTGFVRGNFNVFDIATAVVIQFDSLKYIVSVPYAGISVSKLYQQIFSKEEIHKIITVVKETCLKQIQTKLQH